MNWGINTANLYQILPYLCLIYIIFLLYFQYEASKTNSMVEATLAGSWLCVIFWLGGFILIVVQKYVIRQQKIEQVY